jgi:hypothetical protein
MTLVSPPAVTPAWLQLPRAAALTDALLAPAPAADPSAQAALAASLRRDLDRLVGPAATRTGGTSAGGQCVRIGGYQLARSLEETAPGTETPFRWSSVTARRALGLAAVSACASGTVASPSAGVSRAITFLRGRGAPAPAVPDSLVEWVGGLPAAARAAVAADATTWATRLWTALEWPRLAAGTTVGGADEWWHHLAGDIRVAVRGRADVRTTATDGATVLFNICGGVPTPAGRAALVLAPLVSALHHPGRAAPGRVVGWWPDSGRAWIVPVDTRALSVAVDGVIAATRRELERGGR